MCGLSRLDDCTQSSVRKMLVQPADSGDHFRNRHRDLGLSINQLEAALDDQKQTALAYIVVPVIWLMTAGMMIVHLTSFFIGSTGVILLMAGIFIPPIGIVNALVFLFSGKALSAYF